MKKNTTIKDRVMEFIDYKQIAKYKFCNIVGLSKGNFSGDALQSELGGDQISKILNTYPEINPDWLILGKGKMIRKNSYNNNNGEKIINNPTSELNEQPTDYNSQHNNPYQFIILKYIDLLDERTKAYYELEQKYNDSLKTIEILKKKLNGN